MKKIINKNDLHPKIIDGMEEIASIVKRTLGPGGLPIIIERSGQAQDGSPLGPRITKDGVSVANECFSEDPEKDLIIQAVKSICKKTNRVAGRSMARNRWQSSIWRPYENSGKYL